MRHGHQALSDRGLQPYHRACTLAPVIREANGRIDIGVLHRLPGDSTGLMQRWQNLLAKACKFRGAAPPYIRIAAVMNALMSPARRTDVVASWPSS
jgi:light-regulated signal transduction histidine kinase (bacteriophytochrome)